MSRTDLFLADMRLVGREYFPSVGIKEMLQKLHIPNDDIQVLVMGCITGLHSTPVVNYEVVVSADRTGAPRSDFLLSDAGLSGFQWKSLAFEIPSVFCPDRVLPISCLKCHTI